MDVRALAFDVFGTVVDWRSSVIDEVGDLARRRGLTVDALAFADAWRRRYQPSMERVRQGLVGWTALDALHRASLDELLREHSLEALDEADREHLNRAWHRLRPWPDAVAGLTRLRPRHVLCTLSNGNVSLLVDLARAGGLPFDCILSAELCQAYKPDPRTYRMAPELLGLAPGQVMMVAAHADDLRAASREGLLTACVERPLEWGSRTRAASEPGSEFDVAAADMEDLATKLGC